MFSKISKYRNAIMGVAILWIVFYHSQFSTESFPTFTSAATFLKSNGFGGVDIFLFVSGFGLFQSLSRDSDTVSFYKRRIRKILPAYLPVLVIWILLNIPSISIKRSPIVLWNNLTGVAFWLQRGPSFNWYILALPAFYLITPVFFKMMERWGKRGELILLILTIGMDLCFLNRYVMIAISRYTIFAIGMIAGRCYFEDISFSPKEEGAFYFLGLLGWGVVYLVEATVPELLWNYGLYWYPFILIAPGSIFLLCRLFDLLDRIKAGRVCRTIFEMMGICSLEIYLIHVKLFEALKSVRSNWFWCALAGLVIVLGYGYHKSIDFLIERKWKPVKDFRKISSKAAVREKKSSERIIHLEFMRIVACFLVIVNHTTGSLLGERDLGVTWFIGLIYFFICKIAVPLFLMISGAVLLEKMDSSRKSIQRILKNGIPFFIASAGYYIYYGVKSETPIRVSDFFLKLLQSQRTNAFWYFYLYLGLLCLLPILQKMVKALNKRDLQWIMFLSVGLLGTISLLKLFFPSFGVSGYFTGVLFSTYIGIYLCGYYIEKHICLNRPKFVLASILFTVLIGFQTIATFYFYQKDPEKYLFLDNRLLITITLSTFCFYIMIKYVFIRLPVHPVIEKTIRYLGSLTFGIYLLSDWMIKVSAPIHQMLREHLHVIPAMILWELLIFAACAVIVVAVTSGKQANKCP